MKNLMGSPAAPTKMGGRPGCEFSYEDEDMGPRRCKGIVRTDEGGKVRVKVYDSRVRVRTFT